jgi:hypothetical protein
MDEVSIGGPNDEPDPLALALVLNDWAARRERGGRFLDSDAAFARSLIREALALEMKLGRPASALETARWKVSWLRLTQLSRRLLSARPSQRTRQWRRAVGAIPSDAIHAALRRKLT